MLIPLGTDRPLRRPTVVTYALVAANVVVFVVMAALHRLAPTTWWMLLHATLLVPGHLTPWGFVTYAFQHANFTHILGNMLVLWVFGPNVEDRFGRLWYLGFYLVGGALAGWFHAIFVDAPVIGASGAIAAMTGAFLVLFPGTRVRVISFIYLGVFMIPAWWFIGLAIAWNLWAQGTGADFGVATLAHLGGYAWGIGLSLGLLWMRLLEREPYDLFSIARQAHRRRQFKEAAAQRDAAARRLATQRRAGPGAPGAEGVGEGNGRVVRDAIAEARAAVTTLLAAGDLAGAAKAYGALVEKHGNATAAVTLSRRHQYDLANYLYMTKDYQFAAFAYERFLEAYAKDSESPVVTLLLAKINAEQLNDPVRAKALLTGLADRLHDPDHQRAAQVLLAELG